MEPAGPTVGVPPGEDCVAGALRAHELAGRRDLTHGWFEGLTAPPKEPITYAEAVIPSSRGDGCLPSPDERDDPTRDIREVKKPRPLARSSRNA